MEYTLATPHGIRMTVSELGAAVRRIETPDRHGCFSNIALSPAASGENPAETAYAGAVLGPSAGRVPGGSVSLHSKPLALTANEGIHHLHGGPHGLASALWLCELATAAEVSFRCDVPAGVDGYPGNRRFWARYSLRGETGFQLRLRCETDAPTWVNLSSHVYLNLCGDFSASVGDHQLTVAASRAYENDAGHLPRACRGVADSVLDLRGNPLLGTLLAADDPQLAIAHGLNHCYVLDGAMPCAMLSHAASGRFAILSTDLPALVVYSGGYLGGLRLEGGALASPACALALEPQLLPVTPSAPEAPFITTPQRPYDHWLAYTFATLSMPQGASVSC